ncbi:tetratricopeptide repeat protein [Thiomicrorhabdus heinhorstiae]|uniref:Tetratricopeptide repeat protein n=1 Tax=Thiomicrorhabdus heinhorstiae TaxID=2748010 RepID=A0ABS0BWM3_9GAMM|nr:hypothetical protein [Thiomicrorhabdus heinhorstiae]MBF6058211.1 hypothetical protein [Thiomicrorhabdus heinhorstiae]
MTTLSLWLSLLLIAALAILFFPLLKQGKHLSKSALLSIGIGLPALTIGLYFYFGTPQFAEISQDDSAPKMVTLVDKLEQKLAKKPDDLSGWLLLGRSYMMTDNYPKAVWAFEHAYQLAPNNLSVLLPLADALSVTQNGRLQGRPYELLQQALKLDAHNKMTLWLLGLAERQKGDIPRAGELWQTLYSQLDPDDPDRKHISALLEQIGQSVTENPGPESKPEDTTASEEKSIQIVVSTETPQTLPAGTTLFVYIKAAEGPPMPIAARKISIKQLPVEVDLSSSDELMANRKLKNFEHLIVGIKLTQGDKQDVSKVLYQAEKPAQMGKKAVFITNINITVS